MSVPVYRRGEQKLTVLTKAIELADYTLTITRNESTFPKRSRWQLTNRIVSAALDVVEFIRKANTVRVEREEDFVRRRAYQQQARECAEWLITLADLAYRNMTTIGGERIEYWVNLIVEVENLLAAWRKSDADAWRKKQKTAEVSTP